MAHEKLERAPGFCRIVPEIGLRIRDNPDAAGRFFSAAEEAFDLLTRHPQAVIHREIPVGGEGR